MKVATQNLHQKYLLFQNKTSEPYYQDLQALKGYIFKDEPFKMLDLKETDVRKFPILKKKRVEIKKELLKKAKSIVNENPIYFHQSQNKGLKKPTARREVAELLQWIDLMVSNITRTKDRSLKEYFNDF